MNWKTLFQKHLTSQITRTPNRRFVAHVWGVMCPKYEGEMMKAKVAVFGTLRFPPEKIDSVLPHLKEFVVATQNYDGCILYEVAEDPFDKGLIRFSELWPDRESLEKHLKAPHISPWRKQAKKYGLMKRTFSSYDISSNEIPV